MTSRLDRLLVLLDSGSSTTVRHTAAKQLAQLAARSVTGDVATQDDIKSQRVHVSASDAVAWRELMSVVARILPYLRSKSHDSRAAAAEALSQIFSLVPIWAPWEVKDEDEVIFDEYKVAEPEFPECSIKDLLNAGKLLLSSAGHEYNKPTGILRDQNAVKRARKAAMSRLGLDFLDNIDGDSMDIDKELAPEIATSDNGDIEMKNDANEIDSNSADDRVIPKITIDTNVGVSLTTGPQKECDASPITSAPLTTFEDVSGLSARERNRLKRKRKPGNAAFIAAPPPSAGGSKFQPQPAGSGQKARLVGVDDADAPRSRISGTPNGTPLSDNAVMDASKGGAITPQTDMERSVALEVADGVWPWDGVARILEVDLLSPAWQVRHGAAMGLRELLKLQGKYGGMQAGRPSKENHLRHEQWCNAIAAQIICVFVLDRFGDFVSDQVVAPVRETVSQTLASLLIHMPRRSVFHVHRLLLQMVQQDFLVGQKHVWEVRHAGLLGIKYEVAVRTDLFETQEEWGAHLDAGGLQFDPKDVLRGIVDAAILGLGDKDDDVRAVAASCLIPIVKEIVEALPEALERVLVILWSCLRDMKDDLSSSVGAVMDLLGKFVSFPAVIDILGDNSHVLPLSALASTLFSFFRHTIPTVRLAVVKTLCSFMTVPSLPRDWISSPFVQLLFQNLLVEERLDIREVTMNAWQMTLQTLSSSLGWMQNVITEPHILTWFNVTMIPIGTPMDVSSFYDPSVQELELSKPIDRHNVDKDIISQDSLLVSQELTLKTRIAACRALAAIIFYQPSMEQADTIFSPLLSHYIDSVSAHQKSMAAIVVAEWATQTSDANSSSSIESSTLARHLSEKLLKWLQSTPPAAYHEMIPGLARLQTDCQNLLQRFFRDCKQPASSIPQLPSDLDIFGTRLDAFSLDTARNASGAMFFSLKDALGRSKKRELSLILDDRTKVLTSIDRYEQLKSVYDTRVSAAFAEAFIALKATPEKVSPVVKGIMNGIKNEENEDCQQRSASAVASFIKFCSQLSLSQPPEKIIKNLCTFLCQDSDETPTFAYSQDLNEGILSFANSDNSLRKEHDIDSSSDTEHKTKVSRRGAEAAFKELSVTFGPQLLELVPSVWSSMVGGLVSVCASDSMDALDEIVASQHGQDVIDSLSVLNAVIPTLHPDLRSRFIDLFPMLSMTVRSRFAIIRMAAAKCFATFCSVATAPAMRYVIEHMLGYLGDPLNLYMRQGVTELLFHVVQKLDINALPYVIFLIVPVLGRMSDSNDAIRATATNTFASLIKMVPLESGLPDPPNFSKELLERRLAERQFLTQLLDGSKVEQYTLPAPIQAELRKYQQDGVNWLAFLAKYQLHGILCDDMGLGKTLQSICILSGKHFERTRRFEDTKSPDAVPLSSLIICPPTLTGHWYNEVLKFATNLKPVLYTGSARGRKSILTTLNTFDVVITSYEVIRNDIAELQGLNWLYCILDEGHVIKNGKTKLTQAVKRLRAQHRLILSGTPIQNNVLELWSLFDFLMPGFLGTEATFNERFGKPIIQNRDGKSKNGEAAAIALEALHKQVLPFLLRRLKEDVLHDLPPKIIQDHYCELSDLQKQLYDEFSNSPARTTAEADVKSVSNAKETSQNHIFQSLQYLRKLCNHPLLVLGDDPQVISTALIKAGVKPDSLHEISHAPKLLALQQLLTDCGIGGGSTQIDAGKIDVDLIAESGSTLSQHRVLIFCQMKKMIDIIENDLFKKHMPSVTYMRLDGSTQTNKRFAVVETFNSDPSIDVLLLTTHVGGLGLTLTGADTVIFVEHDWNPMKDLQAMDRAHRIGQKKVVNVYRLITKGTLEEKIMGLQRFKLNIANSVVTQQNSGLDTMDTDLVLDLFKRTTTEEDIVASAKRKAQENNGPVSQKNVLQGLEDLPPEDEYEGLDLSSFMNTLTKK